MIPLPLILILALVITQAEHGPESKARTAALELGKTLKRTLLATMQAEGAVAAIGVCHEDAPAIASAVGDRLAVDVGRTALRWRNPANAPDDWQSATMKGFAAALDDGAAPSSLFAHRRRATAEGVTNEVLLPIVTEGPCLACHGSELAPAVAAAIDARYPHDRARGFSVGDLRGAFRVEWTEAAASD